jgi:preprotein translocase subunit SecF
MILACVLVVGVVSFFVRGTNIDIDFSGGTEIQIDVGTEVNDAVCKRINEIIETEPTLGRSYVSST